MAFIDEDIHKRMDFLRTNSMVEVNRNNNGAWYVAKILSSYYSSFTQKHKFLVQYQTLLSQFHSGEYFTECVDSSFIRPLPPPPAAGQSYEPLDIVDALHLGGWRKGVVSQVGVLEKNSKSKGYGVVFSNPPEKFLFCSANLRFHLDWTNGKWVSPPKLKVLINRPQHEEQSAVTKGSSKNLLQQSNRLIANISEEYKKEKFANHSCPEPSHVTSMLMESTKQATDSAIASFSTCDSGGKLLLDGSYNSDKGSDTALLNRPEEQLAVGKDSIKDRLEQSNPLIATSKSEKLASPAPVTEDTIPNNSNGFQKENFSYPSSPKLSHVTPMLMESAEQPTDTAIANFSTCDSGGNLPLARSYNSDKGSNTGADRQEAELEKGMAEISMKREEELNAQVAVGEDETNENRLEGINEGNVENLNQSSAANVRAEGELVENYETPFTKSSSIWQFIDSLQVFQFLPQKPHFRPLLESYEATREGFAIGQMWNFANLVEMASKLQIENPTSLFETYSEALAYLELLGFDVKVVVNRINKLMSIKTRQEQLDNQSKDIHSKISQCFAEKTEMVEEIDAIGKMIKELKARRAMEVSKKAMLESESNLLRMNANRINEDVSNAKQDFETLAAAPWKNLPGKKQ